MVMFLRSTLLILCLLSTLHQAIARSSKAADESPPHIWTVGAFRDDKKHISCDAFASGMIGRPLYEIRFRREPTNLLLIVAYDGPVIRPATTATVLLDGNSVGSFAAVATQFDTRNAVIISLDPASVNFAELETHNRMEIIVGSERFGMAFLQAEHVSDRMHRCVTTMMK